MRLSQLSQEAKDYFFEQILLSYSIKAARLRLYEAIPDAFPYTYSNFVQWKQSPQWDSDWKEYLTRVGDKVKDYPISSRAGRLTILAELVEKLLVEFRFAEKNGSYSDMIKISAELSSLLKQSAEEAKHFEASGVAEWSPFEVAATVIKQMEKIKE